MNKKKGPGFRGQPTANSQQPRANSQEPTDFPYMPFPSTVGCILQAVGFEMSLHQAQALTIGASAHKVMAERLE
jgi:hypothetical protein